MPSPYDLIAAQFLAERTPYREMAYVLRFAMLLQPEAAVHDLDQDKETVTPANLSHQVRKLITGTEQSWDTALWQIVRAAT